MLAADDERIVRLSCAYQAHHPPAVLEALCEIMLSPAALDLRAWWHPLGFFRMDLTSRGAADRYVVHCWPEGMRRTQIPAWTVHRHAWSLESFIVGGALHDSQFDKVDAGRRRKSRGLYLVGSALDGSSLLERTGEDIDLNQSVSARHSAGQFYRVGLDAFHESVVEPSRSCVTLARIGPRQRDRSQVVGDVNGPSRLTYLGAPVDRQLLVDQLRLVGLRVRTR